MIGDALLAIAWLIIVVLAAGWFFRERTDSDFRYLTKRERALDAIKAWNTPDPLPDAKPNVVVERVEVVRVTRDGETVAEPKPDINRLPGVTEEWYGVKRGDIKKED